MKKFRMTALNRGDVIAVFAILIFLLFSTAAMANSLSAILECKGCEHAGDRTTAGQTFYVDSGANITLQRTEQGSGNFAWYKDNAPMPEYNHSNSTDFYAWQDTKYTLIVTDSLGFSDSFTATIKVAGGSTCVPGWEKQGIDIDGKFVDWGETIQTAVGSSLDLEANIDDNECDDYDISWSCNIPDTVSFDQYDSAETTAYIRGDPNHNPEITVAVSAKDGNKLKSQHIFLAIVKNAPPTIQVTYDPPLSYTKFNVYFYGSDDGDGYIKSVDTRLDDSSGNEVSSAHEGNLDAEDSLPILHLKPDAVGIYKLYASVIDNYGTETNLEPPLEIGVKKGTTGDDKPLILMPNDIYCAVGQECVINASETVYRDRSVNLKFYDITDGDNDAPELAKPNGEVCCCGDCRHIFNQSATIKVVGYYGNNEVSSRDDGKIVNVHIFTNGSQSAKQSGAAPKELPEDTKIFAALCLLILLRKKIRWIGTALFLKSGFFCYNQLIMYLFFDTETTGLPLNWSAPVEDLDNWPRMVQAAWILHNDDGSGILTRNYIIKPEGFVIPEVAARIHGITTKIAAREGGSLNDILREFKEMAGKSDFLVGHNISFDEKIMGAEFLRKGMKNYLAGKKTICTMRSSARYCAIKNHYGYKWPKLSELHYQLFGTGFAAAHNAAADIEVTAKCFWEMRRRGIL